MSAIRVELPGHLRTLAGLTGELVLEVEDPASAARVLDALESKFPMLRGTIRDQQTMQRRAFLRFFACEEDVSFAGMDAPLPAKVIEGREAFLIIGAVAGGA